MALPWHPVVPMGPVLCGKARRRPVPPQSGTQKDAEEERLASDGYQHPDAPAPLWRVHGGVVALCLLSLILSFRSPFLAGHLLHPVRALLRRVFDIAQKHHSLLRNYPIVASVRWVFEALRPICASTSWKATWRVSPSTGRSAASSMPAPRARKNRQPFGTELERAIPNMNG